MSRWTEYIKLLPSGLKNLPQIWEGMVNSVKLEYGHLPEDRQQEILKRRALCEGCPFNSRNATTSQEYKELTGQSYQTERPELHCSFCGCPLSYRTASLEKGCGIESWNLSNPNRPLALKWHAYPSKPSLHETGQ